MTSGVSFFSSFFAALESFTAPSTIALLVLAIAALIDYIIGDPWGWPHPVRVMGWAIACYQKIVFRYLKSPLGERVAGVILGLGLVAGSGWVGWAIAAGTTWIHAGLGVAVQSILLASCFAGRSLRSAAEDVMQPLSNGDLVQARTQLSFYVGRDTENLSELEVLRAVLETVTENATDGVMAPLFYALLGAALPGVGVVPLAIAYKAASTLDSMVGYREAPYTHLGWFSAQMEDRLTWLPCRLVVLTLALLSRKPGYVWRICRRDAIADASPNSGWSECAYAAVLGVQVGGINWYRGVAKPKPLLGEPIHATTPERIYQALQLTRISFLLWLGLGIFSLSLWSGIVFSRGQLP
uniref:adenosylcobinamide-phosphate synthase CbiB n=1 Tax=Trichocoleus desertorum TaxID=1481672 RepID=UPI0025B2C26F|nr:adenosylcobinamide-phosphate synthase CbiB [Trichocoleus desertorum]